MQMAISVGAYFFIFRHKYGTNLKKNCAGLKSPASPGDYVRLLNSASVTAVATAALRDSEPGSSAG